VAKFGTSRFFDARVRDHVEFDKLDNFFAVMKSTKRPSGLYHVSWSIPTTISPIRSRNAKSHQMALMAAGNFSISWPAFFEHQTFHKKVVEVVWGCTSPKKPKQPESLGKLTTWQHRGHFWQPPIYLFIYFIIAMMHDFAFLTTLFLVKNPKSPKNLTTPQNFYEKADEFHSANYIV
jgi:hypothetical protein